METPPILFGKDTTTGTITQLQTLGNVLLTTNGTLNDLTDVIISSSITGQYLFYNGSNWVNSTPSTKDYIIFNMFGTTQPAVYSTTTEKVLIQSTGTYWVATVPNPNTSTGGQIQSLRSSVYTSATGFISLDSSKNYIITATLNMNGQNINAVTNIEWAIKNTSSGSVVNFSPNFVNVGTMQQDFTGMGITTSAYVSSCSSFTCTVRIVTASTTVLGGVDTNISMTVMEV
jgi:hypothetical protein